MYKVDIKKKRYDILCNLDFVKSSGIVYDEKNKRLVFITQTKSPKIYEISLKDNRLKLLYDTGIGNCDGITMDKKGYFYSGSWQTGNLYRFSIKEGARGNTPIISGLVTTVYSYIDSDNQTIAIPC